MNASAPVNQSWSRRRIWVVTLLIFAAHVIAIFLLAERKPIVPRPVKRTLQLRLNAEQSEFLALNNPTLFALPNPKGFSGPVWMHRKEKLHEAFQWPEPDHRLALPVQQLGSAFLLFMETNTSRRFEPEIKPLPELSFPPALFVQTNDARSTWEMDENLASRSVSDPPALPPWQNTELLLNTIVQLLVDGAGNIVSRTLMQPSGSKEADQFAINATRALRFAPVRNNTAETKPSWTRGNLTFQWVTLPPAPTNSVPTAP